MSSTFVVLDPVLKIIKMNGVGEDKKIYEYPCIQVSDLQCLLVDGKFCSGFASSATLNSTFFNYIIKRIFLCFYLFFFP